MDFTAPILGDAVKAMLSPHLLLELPQTKVRLKQITICIAFPPGQIFLLVFYTYTYVLNHAESNKTNRFHLSCCLCSFFVFTYLPSK